MTSRREAAHWLSAEKQRGDDDIVCFASRVTWNGLLPSGLIDELHLTISPTALDTGIPLFTGPALRSGSSTHKH